MGRLIFTAPDLMDHLRITDVADQSVLDLCQYAAVEHMERTLGIQFLRQTCTQVRDWTESPSLESCIELRGTPLASVSSIAYVDTAGVTQTWSSANYVVDTACQPGRVCLAYGASWPDVRDQPKVMTITYICGWASTALIPAPLLHALRLMVGHLFEHREGSVDGASQSPILIPMGYDALVRIAASLPARQRKGLQAVTGAMRHGNEHSRFPHRSSAPLFAPESGSGKPGQMRASPEGLPGLDSRT